MKNIFYAIDGRVNSSRSRVRAADYAENKSQSCYLEHTPATQYSTYILVALTLTLNLPPPVVEGGKSNFPHHNSIPFPKTSPRKFRADKLHRASTSILVESTTLCYMLYQRTIKLLNIQHKHVHTLTQSRNTTQHKTHQTLYRKQLYMPVSNPY